MLFILMIDNNFSKNKIILKNARAKIATNIVLRKIENKVKDEFKRFD